MYVCVHVYDMREGMDIQGRTVIHLHVHSRYSLRMPWKLGQALTRRRGVHSAQAKPVLKHGWHMPASGCPRVQAGHAAAAPL